MKIFYNWYTFFDYEQTMSCFSLSTKLYSEVVKNR